MRSGTRSIVVGAAVALVAWFSVPQALAQTAARTFADLGGVVKVGQEITVTDASGVEVKGKITQLSPTSLSIAAGEATRTFTENEVRLIQQKRADSLLNGTLIGAGVGVGVPLAIAGILCASDDEDCEWDGSAWAAVAVYAGIGAAAGALIDYAVKGNKTVFVPGERTKPSVSFAPLIGRDRKGVQVAVGF